VVPTPAPENIPTYSVMNVEKMKKTLIGLFNE